MKDRSQARPLWISAGMAGALLLLALLAWQLAGPRAPEVISVRMASALDELYRPLEVVSSYGPRDAFTVSVELRGYQPDQPLSVRWYYGGEQIAETRLLTGSAGSGFAGFELVNAEPWPVGPYRVEVLWQGQVLGETRFSVE